MENEEIYTDLNKFTQTWFAGFRVAIYTASTQYYRGYGVIQVLQKGLAQTQNYACIPFPRMCMKSPGYP